MPLLVQDNWASFEAEKTYCQCCARQNYVSNLRQRYTDLGSRMIDPSAFFNNLLVDFGSMFFNVLNSVADGVGEICGQFIIGLKQLGDGNVILPATAAVQMMGYRFDGDEPGIHTNHGIRHCGLCWRIWLCKGSNMIQQTPPGPEVGKCFIFGPSNYLLQLVRVTASVLIRVAYQVLSGGLAQNILRELFPATLPAMEQHPKIFLSHTNVRSFAQWEKIGFQMVKNFGIPDLVIGCDADGSNT
ncbi:hypothetical protein EDB19DRAFT_1829946 [Suillus lakei]|nr:hypothetical protein EDB19DRAFT_1829946 [Suillus lakei]